MTTKEKIEQAARDHAKRSTAPDKETPTPIP